MMPIVIAILTLALAVISLIVKVTVSMNTMQVFVNEMRNERPLVHQIPVLSQRVQHVEQHLGINYFQHTMNGNGE